MAIMHDCIFARSRGDILKIIDLLNDVIPFNAAILCRKDRETRVESIENSINHSFPSAWVESYCENNFGLLDPVARMSANTTKAFTWETAYRGTELTYELAEFIGLAEDHGMKAGIACRCNAYREDDIETLMSIETSGYKLREEYFAIIAYILPHLHEAICRIDKTVQDPENLPNFTLRERETLKWAYEGKTAWEIGVILSISERTVKFHLNNIYKKLDVTNRLQAIAKAIRYGLV